MNIKNIGKGFGIDVLMYIVIALGIAIFYFLLNLHPFMAFVSESSLAQVNANPGILPSQSVLYWGVGLFFLTFVVSCIYAVLIYIFSRKYLYSLLLNKKQSLKKVFFRISTLFFIYVIPIGIVIFILNILSALVRTFIPIPRSLLEIIITFISGYFFSVGMVFFMHMYKHSIKTSIIKYASFFKHKGVGIATIFFGITQLIGYIIGYLFAKIPALVPYEAQWYFIVTLVAFAIIRAYLVEKV
jgi:hypothetical protein